MTSLDYSALTRKIREIGARLLGSLRKPSDEAKTTEYFIAPSEIRQRNLQKTPTLGCYQLSKEEEIMHLSMETARWIQLCKNMTQGKPSLACAQVPDAPLAIALTGIGIRLHTDYRQGGRPPSV